MIEILDTYTFANPLWFLCLLALPLVAWLRGRRSVTAVILPFAGAWRRHSLISGSRMPVSLGFLAATLLAASLARPQKVETERHSKSKGYDIIMALDLSTSMYAEDYRRGREAINRLQAVKPLFNAFVKQRLNDRIGLVAFAGRAYTVAPLTFDHEWLNQQAERLSIGLIEDGTAIGDTLAVATSRLLEGAKERAGEREGAFIILLTDGANTAGMLEPLQGMKLAKEAGIRVFTIAAGRNGIVPFPIFDNEGNRIGTDRRQMRIDPETLQTIADETNGAFFQADDTKTIEEAFKKIDETAKVEFEFSQFSIVTELFHYPLLASGACALLALLSMVGTGKEPIA